MELEQLPLARRSVRHFTAEPVDPADLKKILAAGLSVPSSKNLHSSELVVVTDPEQVHALADCKPQFGQMLREAACAVVVLGATSSHAWVEDASLTLLAMLLQATELGLGSCWVQVRHMHATALGADGKPLTSSDYLREQLGIPEGYEVEAILALGHAAHPLRPHTLQELDWKKVHQERF